MPRRRAMTSHSRIAPRPARHATHAYGVRPWSYAARDRIPSVPNRNAAVTTMRTAESCGRESGMADILGGPGLLLSRAADPDVGERDPQLAERLDRDEEADEQQDG